MELTFKQYADLKHITVQAVYQSFNNHKKEMTGMTYQKGRTRYLTEEGIQYMDDVRKKQIIEVLDDPRIEDLEKRNAQLAKDLTEAQAERDRLRLDLDEMKTKVIQKSEDIIQLQQQIMEVQKMLSDKETGTGGGTDQADPTDPETVTEQPEKKKGFIDKLLSIFS